MYGFSKGPWVTYVHCCVHVRHVQVLPAIPFPGEGRGANSPRRMEGCDCFDPPGRAGAGRFPETLSFPDISGGAMVTESLEHSFSAVASIQRGANSRFHNRGIVIPMIMHFGRIRPRSMVLARNQSNQQCFRRIVTIGRTNPVTSPAAGRPAGSIPVSECPGTWGPASHGQCHAVHRPSVS